MKITSRKTLLLALVSALVLVFSVAAGTVFAEGKGQGKTAGLKDLKPHVIVHYTHNGKNHGGKGRSRPIEWCKSTSSC